MAERKSFLLRIDAALYEAIRRLASADLRSVNGQIEFMLRRAVDRRLGSGARGVSDQGPGEASTGEPE